MLKNYLIKDLDEAIKTCFEYIFLNEKIQNKKKTFDKVVQEYVKTEYLYHFPINAILKVTSSCNLRCKHCFYYSKQQEFNSDNDFSIEELLKLAELLIDELNLIKIIITGGEPFLQKDIFQLLKYLKSKNVCIQIQTNATLITEEIIIELTKILNPKTDNIQVSLDGAEPEIHDNIRGSGNFIKTTKVIKKLTDNNISVVISYTVNSENTDNIVLLNDLCKNLGVKNLILGKFQSCSKEQDYLNPNQESMFKSGASLIKAMGDEDNLQLKLPCLSARSFLNYEKGKQLLDKYLSENNPKPPDSLLCHNHDKISICADGRIGLCPVLEDKEFCLGNLKEQPFYEIWENRSDNIFFCERKLENSVCKYCEYVSLCKSGCPAEAYFKYGTINAPTSDCLYGKKLMEKYNMEGNIC